MNISNKKEGVLCDLCRYNTSFIKAYVLIPGFRYMFYFRLCNVVPKILKPFFKIRLRIVGRRYGIQIPSDTNIGEGFYIGHFGTIIINGRAKIGKNVNISQGVTIGQVNMDGGKVGYPTIGDRVYIAPGSKILEIGRAHV